MNQIDLSNPVLAVAMLTQKITELEDKKMDSSSDSSSVISSSAKAELSECLKQRGALLMAMGDKEGAESDMKRYLELNPEKVGELTGKFKAEGRENCH